MMQVEPVDILLVDDNPNDVELALRALRKRNLANAVQVARDGAEALDFIFGRGAFANRSMDQTPKVVLLDLKLPKVDGLEVLREMKLDERTKTIPVVVLTSSQESQDLKEAYRLGANSYIAKPVNFEELAASVSEAGFYWLLLNKAPSA